MQMEYSCECEYFKIEFEFNDFFHGKKVFAEASNAICNKRNDTTMLHPVYNERNCNCRHGKV